MSKASVLASIKDNTYLGGLTASQSKKLLSDLADLTTIRGSFANDAAAAAAVPPVEIGEAYHTAGAVKVRLA